ncbi:hypothetical protein MSHv_03320 [Mycoplasmopsis synoviae]|nr:hypothetical protein MSHv_03320 [Mycoplasmopsis synoviae]AQU48129.1 hypothetical protein ADF19_03320 [Mycoplasmopsis synoviae]
MVVPTIYKEIIKRVKIIFFVISLEDQKLDQLFFNLDPKV